MYAIYGNIYHQYTPNVSKYTSTMDPMGSSLLQLRAIFSPGVSAEWDIQRFLVCSWTTFEKLEWYAERNSQATLIISYLTLLQSVAAFDRLGLEVWFHSWDTLIFPANISPIGWPAATLVSAILVQGLINSFKRLCFPLSEPLMYGSKASKIIHVHRTLVTWT